MKQAVCIIALLIGYITTTTAQNTPTTIRGRVLTEEKHPIEFANVALLAADSTFVQGTCTRSDGSFEITPASPGSYLLQISSIGYKTLCRACHPGNTGDWTLETDAVTLAETVVTATRPVYKLKAGKLETSIRHSLLASLNNANDVLRHIPGLHSSDEGYTVFGKGTPVIYIDNRLLQDLSELERLSAADIDKVELITNPGAEYEATVKAVVRIRTVRGKSDNFGGNLRAGIIQRRHTAHYEQVGLNYQKNGLSLLGTLHANYQNTKRMQEVRYQIPSEVQWDINNQVHLRNKGLTAGGKASISYDFNPKHSLGASYDFSRLPSYHYDDVSEYTVRQDNALTDRTAHSSQSLQQTTRHQLNAYYQGSLKQLRINFTADLVHGKSYDHQEAQEVSQTEGNRHISSFTHARNRLYAAKLILTHPLGQGELKAGADHTFIRRKDNFLNLQDILSNTDSRIDESKSAAFAEYSLALGKVSLLAGLRFEHAVSDYWEKGEYIPGQSRTYNDWCPNLSIDFPLGKAQASLSYTAKTNRPGFFQLRSTLSYNNRFIYEGGNPLLTPETNHDLQFTTLYRWMQFGLNYQSQGNFGAMLQRSYWGVDAGIRKMFLKQRLTLALRANDLWNSRYGSFMLFGPRLTYTKNANPDSRSFSLTVSYRFNAAGKAYKGGHASEEDLKRL